MATADTKTEKKSSVKIDTVDLSNKLSEAITLDKKSGVATIDPETYVKLLPAGLTKTNVEALRAYDSHILAAGAHALGKLSIPVMKKDANLDKTTLTIPMTGKDYIGISFDRSRQVPSRDENNQPNGTKTKFGAVSAEIVLYGAKTRGQLAAVKSELTEMAAAAFGDK